MGLVNGRRMLGDGPSVVFEISLDSGIFRDTLLTPNSNGGKTITLHSDAAVDAFFEGIEEAEKAWKEYKDTLTKEEEPKEEASIVPPGEVLEEKTEEAQEVEND